METLLLLACCCTPIVALILIIIIINSLNAENEKKTSQLEYQREYHEAKLKIPKMILEKDVRGLNNLRIPKLVIDKNFRWMEDLREFSIEKDTDRAIRDVILSVTNKQTAMKIYKDLKTTSGFFLYTLVENKNFESLLKNDANHLMETLTPKFSEDFYSIRTALIFELAGILSTTQKKALLIYKEWLNKNETYTENTLELLMRLDEMIRLKECEEAYANYDDSQ